MPYYCDCEDYGNFQMDCTEDDTFWCPSLTSCIPTCSEFCDCDVDTTPSGSPTTTEAPNNITTTTPHFDNYCDRVCFGVDTGAFYGDCCQAAYCDCEDYGNFEMSCVQEGTLWCPDQQDCISGCQADCGCQMGSTEAGSTVTDVSQDPTTTPEFEEYCDQICYGAQEAGNRGDCCHRTYCDCESYGNFEMECPGDVNGDDEDALWCPAQNSCVQNCFAACDC